MRTIIAFGLIASLVTACDVGAGDFEEEDSIDEATGSLAAQGVPAEKVVTTGTCSNTFDFEKEFVIRTLDVVEDATRTTGTGVWTFGHLVTQIAGTRDPKDLAREWLQTWRASPVLNGETIYGNASKVDDVLLSAWGDDNFALDKAPFRLLAIAMRPDSPGGAELRFVFGATSPAPARVALAMNVAFEYRISEAFMKKWHTTLRPLATGSVAYRDALASLTEEAIRDTTKINNSALAQVRTNEAAIDSPWDLREFTLTGAQGATLARAPLKGQPKTKLDGDARLANGVGPGEETYSAIIPSRNFAWNAPGLNGEQRFKFAMGTCAGCHAKETRTEFVHIKPREKGERSKLSSFLQSRTCAAGDAACTQMEQAGDFTDPVAPTHKFTTQDDRMTALNKILAAQGACQP